MIDNCLFHHLGNSIRTHATSKLIISLTKSFLVIFFTKGRKKKFAFFCSKNLGFVTFFRFKVEVCFELSHYEKINLFSDFSKLHLWLFMTWYLLNKKCSYNEFLAKESLMAMLSDGLKIKFNSSVLFLRIQFTFWVYFFVGHPVE